MGEVTNGTGSGVDLGRWIPIFPLPSTVLLPRVAQAQTATVSGIVTDSTGAIVLGAEVTITNVATGSARSVTSNEAGLYTVPLLPPGEYQISVEQQGFRSVVRSGIVLQVEQRATVNFTLEVGAVTEQIEVLRTQCS